MCIRDRLWREMGEGIAAADWTGGDSGGEKQGKKGKFFHLHHVSTPLSVDFKRTEIKQNAPHLQWGAFLVRPMRFERTTFRVGVWHSIQLSYGRISWIDLYIITERSKKVKRGKGRNWRTKNRCKKGRKGRKVRFFKKSQKKGKKGVDKRKLAWYYNWAVWERHTRAVQ